LGVISGHIEEVMKAFDVMCHAAGWAPRFRLALRLLDAPDPLRREGEEP
jgi:hypothetical protein